MINPKTHPCQILKALNLPDSAHARFDVYDASAYNDANCELSQVLRSPDDLEHVLSGLKGGLDLALRSDVLIDGKVKHIPFVDLSTFRVEEAFLLKPNSPRALEKLPQVWNKEPVIFNSGNSFHAYWPTLLSPEEWSCFMGSLLLAIGVDQNWVGYSLVRGYAGLRWSANSENKQTMPFLVKEPSVDADEFWASVESKAEQVKKWPKWKTGRVFE